MSNIFGNFFDSIKGSVVAGFDAIALFLKQITVVGMNIGEILLFALFLTVIFSIIAVPAKVFEWAQKFRKPIKRVMKWLRN